MTGSNRGATVMVDAANVDEVIRVGEGLGKRFAICPVPAFG